VAGSTEHLGPAAQSCPQAGFAGLALTHFQKASGQIGARHGIVRTKRQGMPADVGGRGIFAFQQQDASERDQYFRTCRRSFESIQKDCARPAALVLVEMQACKVQSQVNVFGR